MHHCLRVDRQTDFTLPLKILIFLLNKGETATEQLCVLRHLLDRGKGALCKVTLGGNDLY